jgi:hypothetical protein
MNSFAQRKKESVSNMETHALSESDAQIVCEHLEREFSSRYSRSVKVTNLTLTPFAGQTSYSVQILDARIDSGDEFKIFLKDYGHTHLPKDGLRQRRNREHQVYRDLLAHVNVHTPEYFGARWDPEEERYWIFIEFVEGMSLRDRSFDDWVRAAEWLADFRGAFTHRNEELGAADFLVCHDAEFFHSKARIALGSISDISPVHARRMKQVLDGYDEIVDMLVSQPKTLVHGSFRRPNILVAGNDSSVRICPVDWELTAWGGYFYDLAFITEGFGPQKRSTMLNAYLNQADKHEISCGNPKEMEHVIEGLLLHKTIKSLSDSLAYGFSVTTIDKLVGMAEETREKISL